MKRWRIALLNNWRVKLAALLTATVLWLLIKHNITASGGVLPTVDPMSVVR